MLKLGRGVARIPERRLTDQKQQRHGDAAIALMLAYAASRAEPEEYGYRGAPNPLQAAREPGYGRDRPDHSDDFRPARRIGRDLRGSL
jgi:phage FluMu gp28-like protein